jgi:hypothetical protein
MADPVDSDPMQSVLEHHVARMQEIANEGFGAAKTACNESLTRLNRTLGLKDAVLDKTLTALGIAPPTKPE